MNASDDLATRLTANFPRWKAWLIALFAVITSALVVPYHSEPNLNHLSVIDIFVMIVGFMQLALTIAMIFILGPEISRRLRRRKEYSIILKQVSAEDQNQYTRMYRVINPIFLYGFTVFIGDSVTLVMNGIADLLNPDLDKTQVIPGINHPSVILSFFDSLMASTEEFWRWSVIVVFLFVFLKLNKKYWEASLKFRRWSLNIAVAISSVVFGFGHIGEFAIYKWQAFILLSLMGANLALYAILTRRYWLALLMHGLYDFVVLSPYSSEMSPYILLLGLFGAVVLAPVVFFLHVKIKRSLTNRVLDHTPRDSANHPV